MPKALTPLERKVVNALVKEGGADDKIPVVEQRYRQKAGAVGKMLARKHVKEAFNKAMEPIRAEQDRQKMVADAVREATTSLEQKTANLEAQLAAATTMEPMRVMGNEAVLEQELMRLARICPEKHGRVKLAALQTAFVVSGILKQGTTERVVPLEGGGTSTVETQGSYTSMFAEMRRQQQEALPTGEANPVLEGEVVDLYPEAETPASDSSISLEPAPKVAAKTKPQPKEAEVIRVSVG